MPLNGSAAFATFSKVASVKKVIHRVIGSFEDDLGCGRS